MLLFREELRESDREAVRAVVSATGMFRPNEIDVAVELVDVKLSLIRQQALRTRGLADDIVLRVAAKAVDCLTDEHRQVTAHILHEPSATRDLIEQDHPPLRPALFVDGPVGLCPDLAR